MLRALAGIGLLLTFVGAASAEFIIADSINANRSNRVDNWKGASEVGWFYTPGTSYDLAGIETRFGSVDGRSVTAELYDAHPEDGGQLLRSASFIASTSFAGGTFSPVSLTAGETYFVGFQNVQKLGVNVTEEEGAVNLAGGLHYSLGNDELYGFGRETGVTAQPILRFLSPEGDIIDPPQGGDPVANAPEPSTLLLGLMGSIGACLGFRRRRKTSSETEEPTTA